MNAHAPVFYGIAELRNGWRLVAAQPTAERCSAHDRQRCRCKVRAYLARPGVPMMGLCFAHAEVTRRTIGGAS